MIYLDNAATTEISDEVFESMLPYLKQNYGNPGSLYKLGRDSLKAVTEAREKVASLINAKAEQIIFTSGGSESNSMVFNGVKEYLRANGKNHIVISEIEHDSVIKAAENMCIKDEFYLHKNGVNPCGVVSLQQLEYTLKQNNVGLVSIMFVNNEIGSTNPIDDIANMCHEYGALLHTDCVQAIGTHQIDVEKYGCDFASFSSHKIHGPKGVGALYVRNLSTISQLIHGGSSQEFGMRGGTENVAGIVGFGTAAQIAEETFQGARIYTQRLKQAFFDSMINLIGDKTNVKLNGAQVSDYGKVINISLKNIDAETLLLLLDTRGVCISSGSACTSHEMDVSHVLKAIGLDNEEAMSSIRVSFSATNLLSEVIEAASILAQCVQQILQ